MKCFFVSCVIYIAARDRRTPGRTPQVSSGGWGCIPATSRRNPTSPDKNPAEPAKNYREILPKSGPGGSPELTELVGDLSGTHPRAQNGKKSKTRSQKIRLVSPRGGFLAILGRGREPKINEKRVRDRRSASGEGGGSVLCRFFLRVPFGVALRTDFWRV